MVQITNVYAPQTRSLSGVTGQQTAQSLHLQRSIQDRRTFTQGFGSQIGKCVSVLTHFRSVLRSPARPSKGRAFAFSSLSAGELISMAINTYLVPDGQARTVDFDRLRLTVRF